MVEKWEVVDRVAEKWEVMGKVGEELKVAVKVSTHSVITPQDPMCTKVQ